MTDRRWAVAAWSVAGGLALTLAVTALWRDPADRLADLHVYVGAVRSLVAGHGLYNWAAANGDGFTYPPFAALLAVPLTLVPEPELRGLWTAGVLLTVVRIARLVLDDAEPSRFGGRPWALPTLLAGLLVSAPVTSTLRFGQVSLLVLAMTLPACLSRRPTTWAAVVLGVAAGIKLTPLAMLPFLWLAGQRRATLTAAGTFVATVGIGGLLLPADSATFWLHLGGLAARIGDPALSGNQSLLGLLARAGVPTPTRTGLWLLGCLLALPALPLAARLHREGRRLAGTALAGTVTVVCSPVAWTHHQLWLLGLAAVPGLARVPVDRRAGLRWGWVLLVLVVVAQPWSPARGALALGAVAVASGRELSRLRPSD